MDNEFNYEEEVEKLNLQVSNHAFDRYKERIKHDDTQILDDETKQKYLYELKKLYLSSKLVYTGVIGHSSGEVDVYVNKHGWVLILGKNQKQVITLYKVDLNVGDEDLNQSYISRSLEKIDNLLNEKKRVLDLVDTNKINYLDEIDSNKVRIKELQAQVNMLTTRNEALNNLVKTEDSKVYQSSIALRDALENYMVKDKLKID